MRFAMLAWIACSAPLCAQDLFGREVERLKSADVKVVSSAIHKLAALDPKRAVPHLLALLEDPRYLSISGHVTQGAMRMWIEQDAKRDALQEIGRMGDARAVPVLERLLGQGVHVAHALYLLTAKSYEYKDANGKPEM